MNIDLNKVSYEKPDIKYWEQQLVWWQKRLMHMDTEWLRDHCRENIERVKRNINELKKGGS